MGKQPAAGGKKTKDAITKAAQAGGKGGKKKWSKGKAKDKLDNNTFLDKKTFETIEKAVPAMKLISVSTLHDKYKIIGSIARRLIRTFEASGKIRAYAQGNHSQYLYTGVDSDKQAAVAPTTAKGGKQAAK